MKKAADEVVFEGAQSKGHTRNRRRSATKTLAPLFLALLLTAIGSAAVSAQAADDPADVDAGREVYANSCAGCHGAEGEGSDSGRSLIDIATQQPDRTVHIASVTDGKGGMPAFGGGLSDEEIDASVSFVRLTFQTAAGDEELPLTGLNGALPFFGAGLLAFGLLLERLSRWNRRPARA